MEKLKFFLKKIEGFLVPSPTVGGLVIGDFSLAYLELAGQNKDEAAKQAVLRLPPGIVEGGRVKDRTNLVAAMKELRKQIREDNEVVNVVLSLPSTSVYVQAFYIPAFASGGNLKEAADLNLRMISPIDFDQAYAGWQKIEDEVGDDGRIKFLGAFIQKTIVDEFSEILREANFGVAAVEFSSLSLVRCLRFGRVLSLKEPQILVHVVSEGINMIITEGGNLYFNYFFPWMATETLTIDEVLKEMRLGLQQIINFYAGRGVGTAIKTVVLITGQLGDRISQEITGTHPDLSVKIASTQKFSVLFGAAKRGLVRKEDDLEIDLSGPSGFKFFSEHKMLDFAITWKNISAFVFGFVLLLFILSLLFINRFSSAITTDTFANPAEIASTLQTLNSEANNFNTLVAANEEAKGVLQKYGTLLSGVGTSADSLSITLQRVMFNGVGQSVTISGTAPSQASASSFKNDLTSLPELSSVDLPFSSITQTSNGVSFTVNFVLSRLN